jgi:hypothetical protein
LKKANFRAIFNVRKIVDSNPEERIDPAFFPELYLTRNSRNMNRRIFLNLTFAAYGKLTICRMSDIFLKSYSAMVIIIC